MSIFFALIAFLGWGTGDIFATITSRKIGSHSTAFWRAIVGLFIYVALTPLMFSNFKNITLLLVGGIGLLSICGTIGLVSFYQGLRVGSASLVGTIGASFAVLTTVLSIIFFHEKVSPIQITSIIIILIGLFLSSIDLKNISIKKVFSDKGVPWALSAMFFWGIYFTFAKIPVSIIGPYLTPFITLMFSTPLLLLYFYIKKAKINIPNKTSVWVPNIINGALLTTAEISYNLGINKGQVSIVAPLAGSYPILFVILAFIIFKDKLTKQQIFGIILGLIGIVILATISP